MTYFFKVSVTACSTAGGTPTTVDGLSTFTKKVILFGSEASVKTFSTDRTALGHCTNLPTVSVQVIDPMILSCDVCECSESNTRSLSIPEEIAAQFGGSFDNVRFNRSITISIGLFSIVQLERQVQIMIPIYDFCIPDKACPPQTSDPCELFGKIAFPTEEFFPPKLADMKDE
jgi:hypothetical protein